MNHNDPSQPAGDDANPSPHAGEASPPVGQPVAPSKDSGAGDRVSGREAQRTSSTPVASTRPWHNRLFYRGCHMIVSLVFALYFRLRIAGRQHIPPGSMLVCCNHQSHLDPVLVGLACRDPMTYLARDTLFVGWFAKLIVYLGAIPIQRDGLGLAGVKRTLERLKIGEKVLIFPEGTRSPDGQLQPFKGGLALLARRAKVPLLPMAIVGAYEAWPKGQAFPAPRTIQVVVGPAIPVEVVATLEDAQLTELLSQEVTACWHAAHEQLAHRQVVNRTSAQRASG